MITRTLVASNNTSYDSVEITQNDNCNNGVLCSIPAKFDTGANFVAAVHKHSWYDRYYITSWIISSDFAISKTTKSEPTADLEWGTSTGSVHKINPFYCHCICYMNSSKSEIFVSLPDSFMSGYAGGNGKAVFDLAGNYVEAIADNNSEYSSVSEVTVYNKDVEIICNETQFGKFDGSYRPTIISSDTYPLVLEYSNSGNGTITNTLGTSSSSLGVDVSGFTNTGFTLMFPDKKHILQVYSNNNIHYGTLVLKNGGFGFSSNGRQLSRALATIQSVASFYFQERCVYFSEEEKTFGLIIPGSYSTNFTPKTYEIPIGNTGGNSKFYPIVMYVEY